MGTHTGARDVSRAGRARARGGADPRIAARAFEYQAGRYHRSFAALPWLARRVAAWRATPALMLAANAAGRRPLAAVGSRSGFFCGSSLRCEVSVSSCAFSACSRRRPGPILRGGEARGAYTTGRAPRGLSE